MPYDRKTKVKMTPGARVLVDEGSAYFAGREVTLVGYEGSADYPRMARVKTDDKLTALLPMDFIRPAAPLPETVTNGNVLACGTREISTNLNIPASENPTKLNTPAPELGPLDIFDLWTLFFAPEGEGGNA